MYDASFFEVEMAKQDHIKHQSIDSGKLIDDIVSLQIKNSKDFESLAVLYKRIFAFLIFKNKNLLLNEHHVDYYMEKEVAAALESVIPRAALGPFVTLNPSEKVTQLVELANLVIGIRLFNKEIGKGGVSLNTVKNVISHESRMLPQYIKTQTMNVIEVC